MSELEQLTLGLTQSNDCSYLPGESERLLVVYPNEQINSYIYQQLMERGFRRGGNDAYRPHCEHCRACQSIRINVDDFTPSKSQKRVLNKAKHITSRWVTEPSQDYFALYSKYISLRHSDGSMYPPQLSALETFTKCNWLNIGFLESYDGDKLIGVAVTDILGNGLSAVYTFFDPDYEALSLGKVHILRQIEQSRKLGLQYLYLGFQIDDCKAMNYKQQYRPNERYIDNRWIKYKN
ncbi:arginyltransferase [Psychrobium sp. MM17-31]|uniref:arginyltransferase n=1 Tax=Psychrobium sp. MM17-31 TaxID=2917758 RepID=UPI001EF69A8A|nr:arginyltransferase [Psychrobium sp. MM17-31]MCG7529846.1 arginyltransferase [Psychrobium sp. MM17-31]